jgi:GTPase SAR1 family protein
MHNEPSKPILIVIAGPNGSGKTSITNQLLKHHWIENCVYINPDQIAEDEFGGWNNIDAIYKAAKIAEERRENCIKENKSLIFETVFSANDKIDFIKIDTNGYEFEIIKSILPQIHKDNPILVVENNKNQNKIYNTLKKNYKKYYYINKNLRIHKKEKCINIFYVPKSISIQ